MATSRYPKTFLGAHLDSLSEGIKVWWQGVQLGLISHILAEQEIESLQEMVLGHKPQGLAP